MKKTTVPAIRREHRVVLIKVPRSLRDGDGESALYEAARKWWVVAAARRDGGPASPEYALVVVRGLVVVAYRIEAWREAPSGGRWGFEGAPSPELTALYRQMDVTTYFPPGAANPLRYVNCAVPRASSDGASERIEPGGLSGKVARLMAEPLTHLLLGHRELSHSNLMAWFFESQPEYADEVFGALTRRRLRASDARGVRREKQHLDLWFSWPDSVPLVIENKVFSLPDEEQLARYAEAATTRREDPSLWLLSLTDPSWPGDRKVLGGREWRWLRFPDLARGIREAIPSRDRSYEAETMRRYAAVVELLSEIADDVVVGESDADPVGLPEAVRAALGERLGTALSKLRALSVAARVQSALADAGISGVAVECGFSNGQPLLSWFGAVPYAKEAVFGWQLQGGQFRLALITPHLGGADRRKRAARFEFAAKHEALFDFARVDRVLGAGRAPLRPVRGPGNPLGFNRYDPDFTYRYKAVPAITVGQLAEAAVVVAKRVGRLR